VANTDYVIVGAGPSLADVIEAVKDATGSDQTDTGWLHPRDEFAALRVVPDPDVDGGAVVTVYYGRDPVALRHELARQVYQHMVAATDWDVTLDSDDTEDIVATRLRTRKN
jgi:hypothetical protein